MSIVFGGAALGLLHGLFVLLGWRVLAVAISWVLLALAVCLVGCVLWFVVDALTARERPTTWRK